MGRAQPLPGKNRLYRLADGVRERFCTRCGEWRVHAPPNFYVQVKKNESFFLHTTCALCCREISREIMRRKQAAYRAQREYAKAAIGGRIG